MADFTEKQIQLVWEKGKAVKNYDKDKYRQDPCGAWIVRDKYGSQGSHGWQIDHAYPSSKGGDEDIRNLRPMHWKNNQSKGDDYPNYTYKVKAEGKKNVEIEASIVVHDDLQKTLKTLYKIK